MTLRLRPKSFSSQSAPPAEIAAQILAELGKVTAHYNFAPLDS